MDQRAQTGPANGDHQFARRSPHSALDGSDVSALLAALAEGLVVYDRNGRIREINDQAAAMYGVSRDSALGRRATAHDLGITFLLPGGRIPRYGELPTVRAFESGTAQRNQRVIVRRADGSVVHVRANSAPIFGSRGEVEGVMVTYTDVTTEAEAEDARVRAEAEVRRLAYTDPLTGLANRTAFGNHIGAVLSSDLPSEVAVAFLDLDRFKNVNDAMSHAAGDDVLREAARRIVSVLREDDLAARIGGDEFAIVLAAVRDQQQAEAIAARLLDAFREPWRLRYDLRQTASIGLAIHPAHGQDAATLIQSADLAMYDAKARGRDQFAFYHPGLNDGAVDTLTLEADLERAVDRNQFELYYQPVVDVKSGQIIGAEALLRWRHPTRGLLLPQDFIGLAEESGIILSLDRSVVRQACAQVREWRAQALPRVRISVNLSARHFRAGTVSHWVARALADAELDPHDLILEISEATVISELTSAATAIHELRGLGVGVAVDDFGTGYSALSYLRDLPADTLKIDRTFVSRINTEPADLAIASAIITLGSSLGLEVVAEGVESAEQLAMLADLGCRTYQGDYFSPALPPHEFATLLSEGRGRAYRAA